MKARNRRIAQRIGIAIPLVGIVALIALLIFANSFDWNRARPWINRSVTATIERPFSIEGELRLDWVRSVGPLRWRIPRPQISASNIVIGNPEWARDDFGKIQKLTAVIDPLPLFRRTVVLPLLDIETAHIALERRADDSNNWTFGSADAEPSQWRFAPGLLRIHSSTLQLRDAKRSMTLQAEADSYDKGVRWTVKGKLNEAPLHGRGSAGSLLALQDKKTPYPIEFILDVGSVHVAANGTLTNPSQLAALDVNLQLSGASMAHLYGLTGIVLPETPAFSTEGRLTGVLDEFGGKWRYQRFTGIVGNSDLSGDFSYEARPQRPLVTAKLISRSLNFADLAPLIGADSNASKARRNAAVRQPDDKVLPVEAFKTDRWNKIDAKVQFDGEEIIRAESLPIDHLHTVVDLTDGVLKLHPLQFGMAGGQLNSTIVLDSNQQPLHADIKIDPRQLKLKELFPTIESMQQSAGQINGSAQLQGTGNSIAALLGSADGTVNLLVDRGTISKFILEAAGLNMANVIATKLFGDRQVNLNCAAADFKVSAGVMQPRLFLVDTDIALINVDGEIGLADERLALTIHPQSKGLRVLSLRAPLYLKGTFKQPDVGVDAGVLALRGGGAIALGAVAWPAALLPLIHPPARETSAGNKSSADENGCARLVSTPPSRAAISDIAAGRM